MPSPQAQDAETPRDAVSGASAAGLPGYADLIGLTSEEEAEFAGLSREEAAGLEWAAAEFERRHGPPPPKRFDTPGELAVHLKPVTVQTPALDVIDRALAELEDGGRLIVTMAPQEGKTERISRDFPLWTLVDDPDCRVFMASYGARLATRNGKAIRRAIEEHPDLGLSLAPDAGAAAEWEIAGHSGGVFSTSIGGEGSGKPADLLIIDDPIKNRQQADSQVYRDNIWDWWTDVALARSAKRIVIVLTRWHEDDLAGRLLAEEGSTWKVVNIPAQADYRPDLGETDILGRQPGEFMQSARGRTTEEWEQRKREAGKRGWQALYQGDPAPAGGLVFDITDIRFWTRFPLKATEDTVYLSPSDIKAMWQAESWDLSFTGDATSDWVAGQRWAGRGSQRFLLSRRHGQWEFTDQITEILGLVEEQPTNVTTRLVEKAANGAAALSTLKGVVGGLRPIKPTESKEARAIAVTPQFEAHDVFLPDPTDPGNEWVLEVIEEMRQFPTGKHDDEVDAMTQFLNWAKNRGVLAAAQPMSAWGKPVDVQRAG